MLSLSAILTSLLSYNIHSIEWLPNQVHLEFLWSIQSSQWCIWLWDISFWNKMEESSWPAVNLATQLRLTVPLSLDISLIQVIKMLLTMLANTWNLNPKSIVKRTSLSFIGVNKNSCLRLSFLYVPRLPLAKQVANSKGEGVWGASFVLCFPPSQYCIDHTFSLR